MSLVNDMLEELRAREPHQVDPDPLRGLRPALRKRSGVRGAIAAAALAGCMVAVALLVGSMNGTAPVPAEATPPAPSAEGVERLPAVASPPLVSGEPVAAPPAPAAPRARLAELPASAPGPEAPAAEQPAEAGPEAAASSATPAALDPFAGEAPASQRERAARAAAEGHEFFAAGRSAAAFSFWRRALRLDPELPELRELLARHLASGGRVEEARAWIAEARDRSPERSGLAVLAARIEVAAKRPGVALEILEGAPENGAVAGFRAALLQRAGQNGEAVRAYRIALAEDPTQARWWLGLAISEEALGHPGEARIAYRHTLSRGEIDEAPRHYAAQRLRALAEISP